MAPNKINYEKIIQELLIIEVLIDAWSFRRSILWDPNSIDSHFQINKITNTSTVAITPINSAAIDQNATFPLPQ